MEGQEVKKNKFLMKFPEKSEFNQYWYSQKTIQFLADQVQRHGKVCAFLSTPSVYYSIQDEEFLKNCYLFEFDSKFEKKNPNFVLYDFNHPEKIPEKFHNFFDFILIDPPFITRDVWEQYGKAGNLLIKKDQETNKVQGKFLTSSIDENKEMLEELIGVQPKAFRPLIPNLVYQYSLYSNYEDEKFNEQNPEVQF